jgi:xanthine phosphoribosyltransferase
VGKEFISSDERILIVDDFLAHGSALTGLIDIVEQAGATVVGCVAAIEKGFQMGGDRLREKGYRIESLAIIEEMDDTEVVFRKQ